MEAFSYYPFLLDSPILASIPFETHLSTRQVGETSNNSSSCFPYYYSPEAILELSSGDTSAYESSISLATATKAPLVECQIPLSSAVIKPHDEKVPKQQGSMEKQRKNGDEARSSYGQSSLRTASTKESKSRKQRKPIGELKGKRGKKPKCDDLKATKAGEEPPEGYIHVRSKRGQATDSHSLAERVRREKISERMKMLQGLVPGCDKVTGKALVLDEIVNYVQSLQNQIEFLSMKLASVNPMLYDFGVDFDNSVNPKAEQKKMKSIQQQVPLVNQTTHIHPPAFENARNNYQMMDPSVPLLLHCQGSTAFPQDGGSSMIQVGEQRQQFINQVEFNNI